MLKWYQEPIIHFLILGMLIFILTQTQTFSSIDSNSKEIIIKENEIDNLISFWKKKYHAMPSEDELDTLLNVYIENEILYREALNMKLDKHDDGIKIRLVDKLKYIISEPINFDKISDKNLQNFFNENQKLFSDNTHTTITFGHIYFNPKEHVYAKDKALQIYTKIKDENLTKTYSDYGDSFYKGSYFSRLSKKEISSIFSHSFFQELQKLPKQEWSKPIASGYGFHLIYIEKISQNKRSFSDIKEEVKNKYIIYKAKQNYEMFYQKVKEKYKIDIEPYTLKSLKK